MDVDNLVKKEAVARHLKIVPVGDGTVGKTSLAQCFKDRAPCGTHYNPTVFDNLSIDHCSEGKLYKIHIWDTAGQEDYDRLRPVAYDKTDIVLFIFDRSNQTSLKNIKTKWIPEIDDHMKRKKSLVKILVENKADLDSKMDDKESTNLLEELKEKVDFYAVTSAVSMYGVEELFESAIKMFDFKKKKQKVCKLRLF
ncbi:MAG: hypothetical protein MHPSP_000871 [Paramarteilia canceri]